MRGKKAKKRGIKPDPRYKSSLAGRIISKIMQHGKRKLAERMFYEAVEQGAKEVNAESPLDFLNQAIDNVRPGLELKARRVGGANYNIPMPVTAARQETLAVRWVVDIARGKKGKAFAQFLKQELVAAFNNEGEAVKKMEDTQRMAEANKAFAHFKW